MSESSQEKTKRNLINCLKDYEWAYQYSLFPLLGGEDKADDQYKANYIITNDVSKLRKRLRERFTKTGMLFELRRMKLRNKFKANYRKDFQQIYATWYTTHELDTDGLNKILESIFPPDSYTCRSRKVSLDKIQSSINTIRRQQLHSKIYGENGVEFDRFSKIHEKFFVSIM